jgi:putative sterol carrier protein
MIRRWFAAGKVGTAYGLIGLFLAATIIGRLTARVSTSGGEIGGITIEDIFREMPRHLNRSAAEGIDAVIQFDLGSEESRYVTIRDRTLSVARGTHHNPSMTLTMTPGDYVDMIRGRLSGQQAFMEGRLKLTGDMGLAMKMQDLFKHP